MRAENGIENPHLSKSGFALNDNTVSEIAMDSGE